MGRVSGKGFANNGELRYNDQEGLLSGCSGISKTGYAVFDCFHFFRASPKSEWDIPLILGETRVAEGKLTIFPANNEKRRCET